MLERRLFVEDGSNNSVVRAEGDQPAISVGYSASKAYLLAFSEGLDNELASYGVHVQAVLPGATCTGLWAKGGIDINTLPQEVVVETDDMVDAATVMALALADLLGAARV